MLDLLFAGRSTDSGCRSRGAEAAPRRCCSRCSSTRADRQHPCPDGRIELDPAAACSPDRRAAGRPARGARAAQRSGPGPAAPAGRAVAPAPPPRSRSLLQGRRGPLAPGLQRSRSRAPDRPRAASRARCRARRRTSCSRTLGEPRQLGLEAVARAVVGWRQRSQQRSRDQRHRDRQRRRPDARPQSTAGHVATPVGHTRSPAAERSARRGRHRAVAERAQMSRGRAALFRAAVRGGMPIHRQRSRNRRFPGTASALDQLRRTIASRTVGGKAGSPENRELLCVKILTVF